jgi:hypothetical protein
MRTQDLVESFFVQTLLATGHTLGLEPGEDTYQRVCPVQLDDETIHAYLLGKLGEHERVQVNHHLNDECCEECAKRVQEASLFLGVTKAEVEKSQEGAWLMKPNSAFTVLCFFLMGIALIIIPLLVLKFPESKSADKFQKIIVFIGYIAAGLLSISLGVARMLGKFWRYHNF